MININVSGNLGRDAEWRGNVGRDGALSFSVASTKKGKNGDKVTTWVGCTMWGKRGERLAQYLTKGTRVHVCGEGDLRTYQARDGTTKAELSVNVSEISLLGGGQRDDTAGSGQRASGGAGSGGGYSDDEYGGPTGGEGDDIPF